ncbi:MAG: hypothetical protein M3277_07290 [Actinomycetota bacterium]|nr:hypothetical protein [Actinomycetota bacterium]
MRRGFRYTAVLGSLALVAALAVPVSPAAAGHGGALTVQVGQHFGVGANCNQQTFQGCRGGESMRFLTPNLRVHKGDTVTMDFHGFHTATLLPKNSDVFGWIQANTPGTSNPFSLFVPDPDDTPLDGGTAEKPSVKVNPAVQFPTDPTCGTTTDNPCDYTGALLNSGVPEGEGDEPITFSAEINANAGDHVWVLCLIHPHMFFKVTVVPDSQATSTQADIDAFKAAVLAGDLDWAQAQDAKLINKRSSHVTASGQKVYDVYAGVDNHRVSLSAMYPAKTVVPKGATVRFHFDELIYEHHTVTMSFQEGLERGQEMFSPWCDPDTDSGPGPDEPPDFSAGPPCGGDFSKFEVDIPSPLWNVTGDGVFTGNDDFENSGFRGGLQYSLASHDVKFQKPSNRKGWKFFCLVHGPFMSGRVRVKG